MGTGEPAATVVVATRNRSERLRMLLESLRAQSLPARSFEVIVVDDGSEDGTAELLRAEQARPGLNLRTIRRVGQGGPGMARNEGWRATDAPLVAFIDDDCTATPQWLEAGVEAAGANPGAIVQGRTNPDPDEERAAGPFSYTIIATQLGPHYETCNIFYPRRLLEQMGGFDAEAFPGGGEDCDLAWRSIEAGAPTVFAPRAQVFHAVHELGPIGHLQRAWHWTDTMLIYARHPGLREAHMFRRLFWKAEHHAITRVLLLPLVPRRLRLLRRWLVWRWVAELGMRAKAIVGPFKAVLLIPYLVVHDLVEIAAVVRGAIRYRTPII